MRFFLILLLILIPGTGFSSPAIRSILQKLVEMDTTNPPGNELQAAHYAQSLMTEKNLEVKVFPSTNGRGNVWVRYKGNGTKRPFLMMAHLDVVAAPRADWETDPFRVIEKDGYLYGRGVLDDKGMVAAGILVMKKLAATKPNLDRDVILFLGADEESGGEFGIEWMLEHHPDLMDAEVVLNEGGEILLEEGKMTRAAVQCYEKLFMNVTMTAEGVSGHSSRPHPDNAIVRLSRALGKIGEHQFPAIINPVTRAYFSGLAEQKDHPLRKEFKILATKDPSTRIFQKAAASVSQDAGDNSFLRTTCVPTMVNAGFRSNAIPGKAEATINCRVLPTQTKEDILAELTKVVDDSRVTLSTEGMSRPALSPPDHEFLKAVEHVMKEMAPDAVTVPFMSAGATDSRKLRHRGIHAYGFLPFPTTSDDSSRMHGNNERMPVKSLEFGEEFLYRLTITFSSTQ